MAIWFILFEGGTTSNFTLAAVAITVGLIMKDIVERIASFSQGAIGGERDKKTGEPRRRMPNQRKVT
jgi:hypothetical protein